MNADTRHPFAERLGAVGIWTGSLEVVPTTRTRELAVELEELGYGAVWVPEVAGRDPFVHLTHILTATTRLVGATGIANIWARDAVTMTAAAKALTEAFPERFLLGLGVSHKNLVSDLRGHDYARPLAAMRSYLDAMDAAPFQGFRPTTPVRRAIAALGPKMLALAAEQTDGAHTYLVPPEHTSIAREAMGAGPLLAVEQMVLLETDPEAARERARRWIAVYVGQPNYQSNLLRLGFSEEDFADGCSDRLVDALVAWGDEEAVVTRVRAHLEAGADHVCIQPLATDARSVPDDQWRALAPAMRELTSAEL